MAEGTRSLDAVNEDGREIKTFSILVTASKSCIEIF